MFPTRMEIAAAAGRGRRRVGGEAKDAPAKRVDQQELNQVVEREAEETVDVAANDPTHAESIA